MDRTKIIRIVAIIIMMAWAVYANAQTPPHPNSGGAQTGGNTVVGGQQGGAPVGNGTYILLILAVAYAGKKTYSMDENIEK